LLTKNPHGFGSVCGGGGGGGGWIKANTDCAKRARAVKVIQCIFVYL